MKRINFSILNRITPVLMFVVIVMIFSSCKDNMEGKTFLTSDDRMIDEYIEQKDADMSEFLKIADKSGFRGMLHAYGTNTCFIPTNAAVKSYFGTTNWETLSSDSLERFMKYHIVRDTIKTADFVDGRLSRANMMGKYLTARTVVDGDEVVIRINRQADMVRGSKDIRVANGIIHKIDRVLTHNPKTVGEMILELPDTYSLFKAVMSESGMTDTLTNNKANGEWYTVFLQSDSSFASKGINNRDDLLAAMAVAQPDYANEPNTLIRLYAQYHCMDRLAYVTDLNLTSAELTLATNQVITFKTNKDSLILNEYRSLSKFEKGVMVNKESEWTDLSCYNGVLIDLAGYIQPVKRGPEAVYWDMAEQPEIKKLKEFRKSGSWVTFYPGDLSELSFGGKNNPTISYAVASAFDNKTQYVYYDYLEIPLRPAVIQWMEIKTPVLTEGTYNVWICWRRGGGNTKFKSTFKQDGKEDQVLPNVFDLGEYFDTSSSPEVKLNKGMKQYNAKQISSVCCSRNLGAIKVDYTGRHILRIDALSGNSQPAWWDMIQFIPVDQNQLWPRFDVEGHAIYPGTACEEIAPAGQDCTGDLNN